MKCLDHGDQSNESLTWRLLSLYLIAFCNLKFYHFMLPFFKFIFSRSFYFYMPGPVEWDKVIAEQQQQKVPVTIQVQLMCDIHCLLKHTISPLFAFLLWYPSLYSDGFPTPGRFELRTGLVDFGLCKVKNGLHVLYFFFFLHRRYTKNFIEVSYRG